jgi:hypothetical protein
MRYSAYYTDCTTSKRTIYDPFTVTIKNPCAEATLSVADSARTGSKSAYVDATSSFTVASIAGSITKSPATCTNLSYLVEIYDDETLLNWTSLITNTVYAALLTDGTTTDANNNPAVKIKASTHFTTVKTVQVRVTYTLVDSLVTNGSNKIVDQFPVTIYPTGYVEACASATVSSTSTIASFSLSVKHLVGSALTDK